MNHQLITEIITFDFVLQNNDMCISNKVIDSDVYACYAPTTNNFGAFTNTGGIGGCTKHGNIEDDKNIPPIRGYQYIVPTDSFCKIRFLER